MLSPRALAPLLVLLLLTACPEPDPKVDPTDSGVTQDAGPDTDAGSDAGTDPDAGTALGILTEALPDGYTSREYSATLAATGGVAPYEWSLATGTLPEGLTLSVEGVLSGTPTGALQSSFTVSVRDSAGTSVQAPLSLTTYALPSITELPAQSHSVGDDVALTLEVTGGKGPFLFSYATPPPGLTVTQMGILQGTLSEAGTFTITVTAMDVNGVTATRAITFNVQRRFAITTPGLPWGTRSESYAFTLTAAYGREPLSWSTTSSLPAGLTLSATGVLAGTPAEQGTFDLTLAVQDADGKTASRQLALSVRAPDSPVFTVGQWNLTYFGSDTQGPIHSSSNGGTSDDLQIAYARDIIRDEAANLWGLVEMVDTADFDTLKAQLPGFNGFLANNTAFVSGGTSPYGNSSQKPGILYDSSLTFQSARLILTDQLTDFSNRPPLRVDFTTEIGGVETPLVVIVVHMRANSADPTGPRDARQRASAALKAYLDQNLPTQHVIVLGDWNDDVDESISLDPGSGAPLPTPYENLVSDPARYTFITRELSLAGDDTTIGFENVVDHTLASNEVASRYVSRSAGVQYVDEQLPDFINIVSDHRPVTSTYVFSTETGPFLRLKSPRAARTRPAACSPSPGRPSA
ncbi:putative Ig domain-containing protein [Pyxidicoccus sp. 3LG]